MRADRTNRPFIEELPLLLEAREMSLRALSRAAGVSDAHLSRVLRKVGYKTPSADLTGRVALALGLPADYFPEYREGVILQTIRGDPSLRDKLYDEIVAERSG
jgi:transcriptional regulator with XRE-family HTH domain